MLITNPGPTDERPNVTLRQISQYPLILPPRHLRTCAEVEMVFLQRGLRYEVRLEMGGWEVIKRYVELGLGISIVMNVCLTGRDRLEVIPVKKYFPQRVYGIVRLEGRPLSPQARHFIETFRRLLSNDRGRHHDPRGRVLGHRRRLQNLAHHRRHRRNPAWQEDEPHLRLDSGRRIEFR